MWWKQNADISYQNSRNQFLKQAISRVERQLQEIKDIQTRKEELMARMEVINRLQAERPKLVRGMMELATSMPEGIFFSSLKRTPDGISFTGVAQSSSRQQFFRGFHVQDQDDLPTRHACSLSRSEAPPERPIHPCRDPEASQNLPLIAL